MTQAKLNHQFGIPLRYANRHGMITGETGTGKTVTLMRLAEQFSRAGVPVFISDAKGDIAPVAATCPTRALDPLGMRSQGDEMSISVAAMGAPLMARALDLSDAQAGILEIVFQVASETGTRLETLADLRAVLLELEGAATDYGRVTGVSVSVINRAILRLELEGGNTFFRAPCFDVADLLESETLEHFSPDDFKRSDIQTGVVSLMRAESLINRPRVYAAFLMFLLEQLWERLPEVGDLDKPRLVMIFDESHLLFRSLPATLLQRIEQTVRLIRSKGVGVYFVTQSADDLPPIIRQQLAHVIRHNREFGIGVCEFESLDARGMPFKPMVAGKDGKAAPRRIRVDLPDCKRHAARAVEFLKPEVDPTAAAMAYEKPEVETGLAAILAERGNNRKLTARDAFADVSVFELVLLVVVLLILVAVVGGLWYLGGPWPWIALGAVIAAIFLA